MPSFEKSPPALIVRFDAVAARHPGRTMTGYATLPPGVVDDDAALDAWLRQAIGFGRTLPAK